MSCRSRSLCLTAALLATLVVNQARGQVIPLQTMSISKLAEGVYGAIYSEMKRDPVQANSLIIIGDDGVCVVDAHYTPSAARATIAEIRKLTKLPVRYVVTTHWHDDHIFGNQEYRAAYPGVSFVAQEYTRKSMILRGAEHRDQLAKAYGNAVTKATTRLKRGVDDSGKAITPEYRQRLTTMLPEYQAYFKDFSSVRVILPDITFDTSLTLHLGSRDVQVLSFGPGNTKGDAVIWLPKEKIAEVGDLVVYPVPYIYGGYPASWVKVLQSVRNLGPELIVPGHGPVMHDFTYVDQVSGLMQSMATQAHDAVSKGLTLEQTRAAFDLKQYRDLFVNGQEDRDGTFEESILQSGIQAAYEEASGAIVEE